MKKTFIEECEALYMKKLAKLNERRQKSVEAYDPNVSGIDYKTDRIDDQIRELNKQYRPIQNVAELLQENKNIQKDNRVYVCMISELERALNMYDPRQVEIIKKRWQNNG